MEAPDKIYVFQHGINAFDPLWHFTKSKEKHTESHEYIRKDALLEWARNMYEKTMTFVSGDIERDNEIHKFALRIVKHIESL